jgi:hypothetical protein
MTTVNLRSVSNEWRVPLHAFDRLCTDLSLARRRFNFDICDMSAPFGDISSDLGEVEGFKANLNVS